MQQSSGNPLFSGPGNAGVPGDYTSPKSPSFTSAASTVSTGIYGNKWAEPVASNGWSKRVLAGAMAALFLVGLGIGIGIGTAIPEPNGALDFTTFPTDTSISQLNANIASLAVGTAVTVNGIVVWDGRLTSARGFYLQTKLGSTTPLGSEAIFVTCGTGSLCTSIKAFSEGAELEVQGTVSSTTDRGDNILKPRVTQNNLSGVKILCNTPTIEVVPNGPKVCAKVRVRQIQFPLPLSLQARDSLLLESLGMMVEIVGAKNGQMTITENQNVASLGELGLSSDGLLPAPTMIAESGPSAQQVELENLRKFIILDDANFASNVVPSLYPEGGLQDNAAQTVRVGFTIPVSSLTGLVVLDRRSRDWRLQPTQLGRQAIPLSIIRPPETERLNGNTVALSKGVQQNNINSAYLRIVSMNVENFFIDPVRSGTCPLFQCRGAQTEAEYVVQSRKIYNSVAQVRPAVMVMQEMQNDPGDDALEQFCAELNAFLGENGGSVGTYTFIATGRTGTDVTKPAFVYDSKLVDPVGAFAVLNFGGGSRPSVAQTFQAKCSQDRFTTVAVHLKSKLPTNCENSNDCESDNPFGEGAFASRRLDHAEKLLDFLQSDPTNSGSNKIIAMGDFNSNRKDRAVNVFTDAGFTDLSSRDNAFPFSFQFQGRMGTLDYALASPSMALACANSAEWHTNSVEPDVMGFGKLGLGNNPFRSSDHDPLILGCDFVGGCAADTKSPSSRAPTNAPVSAATRAPATSPNVAPLKWKAYVNEFHTDNLGVDAGEFVEIAVTSSIDPARVTVELVNGNGGVPYFTASLSTFTRGQTLSCDGDWQQETVFYFRFIPGIQNGPDSIAVAVDDILTDHVSYPDFSIFTPVSGIASGDVPTPVGVAAGGYASGLSMSRVGTGTSSTADVSFTWASGVTATPGAKNEGQVFLCNGASKSPTPRITRTPTTRRPSTKAPVTAG